MSLKDNFNQAIKEILHKEGIVGEDLSMDSKKKSELDRYLDPPRSNSPTESSAEKKSESVIKADDSFDDIPDMPEDLKTADFSAENVYLKPEQFGEGGATKTPVNSGAAVADGVANVDSSSSGFTQFSQFARQSGATARNEEPRRNSSDSYGGGAGTPPPKVPRSTPPFKGKEPDSPYYETEETTVISRNTIIDGNIRSFANISIDGSVKGDVKITKNISVTGKVVGDIECNNSVMTGASMQGNISSKGQVQIDRDSLLLGDIGAQYLDLNGKVKGNIEVGGKAEFKTDAIILGNITASTITVLDGATIQGFVNTTFLQESSTSIFPETIALTD